MKNLWLFIFISVCSADISPGPYREGDRYFYFPGPDNQLHLVDTLDPIDEEFLKAYIANPNKNTYLLSTRKNPTTPEIIINGNVTSLTNSDFNSSKVTVFLVHGWLGDGHDEMNVGLTKSFLKNDDVNVISVDWSNLSHQIYQTSKEGVAKAGHSLGKFITWLSTQGLSLDRTHLVGFSLGGHFVGNAGRALNGKVRRITALDPAQPLWIDDPNRITEKDGRYVEVIHTNTAYCGYPKPCGHVDHYPNGGATMPGCDAIDVPCSHMKSWKYMMAAVEYNHLYGLKCNVFDDMVKDNCKGSRLLMGNDDINKTGSGVYRGVTTKDWPFSLDYV